MSPSMKTKSQSMGINAHGRVLVQTDDNRVTDGTTAEHEGQSLEIDGGGQFQDPSEDHAQAPPDDVTNSQD